MSAPGGTGADEPGPPDDAADDAAVEAASDMDAVPDEPDDSEVEGDSVVEDDSEAPVPVQDPDEDLAETVDAQDPDKSAARGPETADEAAATDDDADPTDDAGPTDDPGERDGLARPADVGQDVEVAASADEPVDEQPGPLGTVVGEGDEARDDAEASGETVASEEDEPSPEAADDGPHEPHLPGRHVAPVTPPGGMGALRRALGPRTSRSQVVVGILCALLGFALVVQVSQTQEDQLSSLRQSDLVRLLDDVTQRSEELEDQVSDLRATRDELKSGSGRQRAALEVAEEQAQTQGILSGRLAAQGPGVQVDIVEGDQSLQAFSMFNVLEELRNAGAEVMEVNGVRLVTQSYFEDTADGIVVDGELITSPFRWTAIGDPSTMETALEIPGGAMAALRSDGARTSITQRDTVEIETTSEPPEPEFATPVPPGGDSNKDD